MKRGCSGILAVVPEWLTNRADGQWNNLKYDVVGKQLNVRDERGAVAYTLSVRIASVSETELVLEYTVGDKSRQARYTREK